MTRAYGVPMRRTAPLRLPRHGDAPDGGAFRRWLHETERPLAIDLFSGAGGLSLGLEAAGYQVALSVDIDEWALETHGHNFQGLALPVDLGDELARDRVVSMLEGVEIALVAGGPPCQPYSRAGRSKIRSLVESGRRDAHDHRRELWRAFLDVIEKVQPRAVVMENVPDMALADHGEVVRHILARLEQAGYNADARLVDTWKYGVPQHRQRLVVVGVAEGSTFEWPQEGEEIRLRDAIGDLPELDPTLDQVGAPEMSYDGPLSDFQRAARKECIGGAADIVYDHVTRAVRRDDLEAFKLMKPGTLYSDLPEHLQRYRADIFDDKYNRLGWDELSRSITAHIAKDGYWYIHPEQHRTLTVREAARVQTFPDHFRFAGTRSHQFAQIGNAVPPALGRVIGEALLRGRDGGSDGMVALAGWRHDVRHAVLTWAEDDYQCAPWAYPTDDPWAVAVGEVLGDSQTGWPLPGDILDLVPTWADATPELLNVLVTMADPGPRRKAMQKLVTVASAVREDPEGWDGEEWMSRSGLGPAHRQWIDLLGWSAGVVASSSVLRVTARVTGTEVDVRNRLSNGRMELAKLVGDSDDAPTINAALRRIGSRLCTAEQPRCELCPLQHLCSGAC